MLCRCSPNIVIEEEYTKVLKNYPELSFRSYNQSLETLVHTGTSCIDQKAVSTKKQAAPAHLALRSSCTPSSLPLDATWPP
mmetsp:Transcript_4382/g.8817  ORF Transcript_4382/g.8817 Transcript_4382/m.8817 type:complete len:81 (-) Transcript_4382:142-384(-)